MKSTYLLDTHALVFWFNKENVSDEFIRFFDTQNDLANILVSSVSFWEIALLIKKGKIALDDVNEWRVSIIENSNIKVIDPTAAEMIESVYLPDYHKDPFDRLLIIQAIKNDALFVTKDEMIKQYKVASFWL